MGGFTGFDPRNDPAETIARIAASRRGRLLRVYRRRLSHEDLEDCYSQATLELLARSRRAPFASAAHVENALEQKLKSRIDDRRRAIGGRSAIEAALAHAVPVDAAAARGSGELEDPAAAVERQVIARAEVRRLRELLADLSRDQQLVLASQVLVGMESSEFCARHCWSAEKYRKVAQRGRAKLRVLLEEYETGERCRRLEPDLLALSAGVADGEGHARARAHVANCRSCARKVGPRDRHGRALGALLPLPGAAGGWLAGKLSGAWSGLRRLAFGLRHPFAQVSAPGGAGVAGGSLAGAGAALKVGLVAFCVAGTAGGYAACAQLGVWPIQGAPKPPTQHHRTSHTTRAKRTVVAMRTHAPTGVRATAPGASTTVAARVTRSATARPRRHARRVSAIAQIKREFGVSRVHAATAVTTGAALAPPTPAVAPSAPTRQARQAQTEFGFER